MTDPTVDPTLQSWVPVAAGSDFPVQNLPFGVFSTDGGPRRVGVAIGGAVVDMDALHHRGLFAGAHLPAGIFARPVLNDYLECGPRAWTAVRAELSALLAAPGPPSSLPVESFLVPAAAATVHLPVDAGDYVDFYSSIDHATNVGRLFRPGDDPLPDNWRHLPAGYHGRSASLVVSGTPVRRPSGQRRGGGDSPEFGPSRRLDFELEVGFVTGPGPAGGGPIGVEGAEHHIFGLVLVNDWSARDIQAWEYRPLGPFLGKSFATTVSPWVVPLAALAPFRVPAPPQDPAPLPYLHIEPNLGLDLRLAVDVNGTTITTTNFSTMYWTMAQQLAHATVNGAAVRSGDLFASGTVSGPDPSSFGSMLELSWNGTRPVTLDGETSRTFLEDGDEVTLHGWCAREHQPRIGFGPCTGTVVPARD